ncbi:MAG TPA: nucleotidyltransferase family protein [Sphingomicrobium sp.]
MRASLISTEFRLVVECCRRAFGSGDDRALRRLSAAADWERFARLVRFHRVHGLAWNALWSAGTDVPEAIADSLSADARDIAATNLRSAAECRELRAAFDGAGIPLLFVKGLTVGALAYRNPMLKMGWDIDVLVAEADVTRAAAELEARGYRRTIPAGTADLARWHARRKESVWSRPDGGLHVELHTRLADNRRLIPAIGVESPRREVTVAEGISLPTLGPDELFAYLCVHGASSLWFRLKWITDVAALLSACSPAEIDRLYQRSQDLGAGRAAGQTLLLADHLYGTLEGCALGDQVERDWVSRRLEAAAFTQLVGNTEGRDPTAGLLGTLPIHWTQLLLLPGPGFVLSEAGRQVRDAVTGGG